MLDYQPVLKKEFTDKRWQRSPDFFFAALDTICPLTCKELPDALMCMPSCFVVADEEYYLSGLLGLGPSENLYVSLEGKWLGKYVPAVYSTFPFMVAKNEAEEGQQILCIDTNSGLLDSIDADERFFNEDGTLNSNLDTVMQFQSQINADRETTQAMCKVLKQHNLLKPWKLTLQQPDEVLNVEGIYCVDEKALNALPDESFIELRKGGVLQLAYCQLLSMKRVSLLTELLSTRFAVSTPAQEFDLDLVENNTLNFDNL